jgi:hypothetical protein
MLCHQYTLITTDIVCNYLCRKIRFFQQANIRTPTINKRNRNADIDIDYSYVQKLAQ